MSVEINNQPQINQSSTQAAGSAADGWDITKGSRTDAPLTGAAGTGGASLVSIFKGLYNLLQSGVASVALAAGTAIVGKFGIDQTTPGTTNGVVVNSGTLTANLGALNGAATDASLQAIKTLLQTQVDVANLYVTDKTNGNVYVRREQVNEQTGAITVSFVNIDGSAPSTAPTASNLVPAASSGFVETGTYDVTTAFTGAAVGDILVRAIFETSAAGAPTSAWYNVTQGTTLASAPSSANVIEATKNVTATLAAGSATIGGVTIAQGADVTTGSQTDANATGTVTTGAFSVISLLKGIHNGLRSTLAANVSTNNSLYINELSNFGFGANGNFSTGARNGNANASPGQAAYYTIKIFVTQPGTLVVTDGNGTGAGSQAINQAIAANTMTIIKVPAMGPTWTPTFTNTNNTAGSAWLSVGFGPA